MLSDIEAGLHYLQLNYKEWGITSIAVPPLGCGLGELEWRVVGPTLYRELAKLGIPVELYAPPGTPNGELIPEFLGEPSSAQLVEARKLHESRLEPGLIPIIEVLRRLEDIPYHWPVGRTTFQKIAYFGTLMGLETGLEYMRSSFGPYSPQLKAKLTKLANNGLVKEERLGRMFMARVGKTFGDAREAYKDEIASAKEIIERLTDLFCRLNTKQAELAATVHFAHKTMKLPSGTKPTEEQVLNEVMEWKQRRRPPYSEIEVAKTIRNLAIHGWLDIVPSAQLPDEVEADLDI